MIKTMSCEQEIQWYKHLHSPTRKLKPTIYYDTQEGVSKEDECRLQIYVARSNDHFFKLKRPEAGAKSKKTKRQTRENSSKRE